MKVTNIAKIEGFRVEIEGYEWDTFYRYSDNSWTVTMGESEEPIYDNELLEQLESLFQEYLKKEVCN